MAYMTESERGGAYALLLYSTGRMADPDERAVDRLRKLVAKFQTPDDLAWRKAMGELIAIALAGRSDFAARMVLHRAASVGEVAWARRSLLPGLIERKRAKTRKAA